MESSLDIKANRKAQKYSLGEKLKRVLWIFCYPFFRFSFRTMFGWRNFLLRCFGASIGKNVHIYNSACIYMPWNLKIGEESAIGEHAYIYNLGLISIGRQSTISHRAHLCAGSHDYKDPSLPLLKPGISLGDQVWICADAFVGPGVDVADGCVIGARAVLNRSTEAWKVYAGNPARVIKNRVIG